MNAQTIGSVTARPGCRRGDAQSQIAAMKSAGFAVSPAPVRLGTTLVELLKG